LISLFTSFGYYSQYKSFGFPSNLTFFSHNSYQILMENN
jgi:hypothetical protein